MHIHTISTSSDHLKSPGLCNSLAEPLSAVISFMRRWILYEPPLFQSFSNQVLLGSFKSRGRQGRRGSQGYAITAAHIIRLEDTYLGIARISKLHNALNRWKARIPLSLSAMHLVLKPQCVRRLRFADIISISVQHLATLEAATFKGYWPYVCYLLDFVPPSQSTKFWGRIPGCWESRALWDTACKTLAWSFDLLYRLFHSALLQSKHVNDSSQSVVALGLNQDYLRCQIILMFSRLCYLQEIVPNYLSCPFCCMSMTECIPHKSVGSMTLSGHGRGQGFAALQMPPDLTHDEFHQRSRFKDLGSCQVQRLAGQLTFCSPYSLL